MKHLQILIAAALIIAGACNNQPDYSGEYIKLLKANGKILKHPVRNKDCFMMYITDYEATKHVMEILRIKRWCRPVVEFEEDTSIKTCRVCLPNWHEIEKRTSKINR